MKISVPKEIVSSLKNSLKNRFKITELLMYCDDNKEITKIDFENEIPEGTKLERIEHFITKLRSKNTVIDLVLLMSKSNKTKDWDEVKEMFAGLQVIFESEGLLKDPPEYKFRQHEFQRVILEEGCVFIDRLHVIVNLLNTLETKKNRLILIDGPPRSGKSHFGFYLSDISLTTQIFKTVRIHLNEILKNPTDQITAKKIASEVQEQLGIERWDNIEAQKELKIQSFIRALTNTIDNSTRPVVIFMDQFTEGMNENVIQLVDRMAIMVQTYTTNCILILSGYQAELPRNYGNRINPIELNSFDENQIKNWLARLYDITRDDIKQNEDLESFTNKTFEQLQLTKIIEDSSGCNVSKLSNTLNSLIEIVS
tara:strand:+ start:12526 stop:13629 length:1104 start_codon:yes stop_codon:yes gene_type:complete